MTAPVLEIRDLSIRFGGLRAVDHVSFSIARNRITTIIGPNGAGKSTLFKLLAGVLAPLSGTISLDGAPYAPWRTGNSVFALATQNPDHQWCGATLAEDMGRRRAALARFPGIVMPGGPVTIYPVAGAFLAVGADIGAALAFVTSWTLLGYARALVWELPFFGPDFVLWRMAIAPLFPIFVGLLGRFVAKVLFARGIKL